MYRDTQADSTHWTLSDHRILHSSIEIPKLAPSSGGRYIKREILQPKIPKATLKGILLDPRWPDLPFIEVASLRNLTKWVKIPRDHLHNMKKYKNSKLEDGSDIVAIIE